ncbi:MAG: sn-glycerol-3-phosphate ABC transporter ATP-binding protein UgpC [Planctomycetota bacterium]|nr:MAG: sn-glycerol-3-phosphate ABC transporter ATP-binding protein UgpC [Planctomycetota bacterium]
MAQVLLENVTKLYDGNVTAVNNLNLEVADRQLMVIVGPSGCGKTTILRMIAGLEKPTSGTVAIGDKIVNDITPNNRDVIMVFQNYALYPHMTVFENMAFGLKIRKYPKNEIKKRVAEAAMLLDIENLLDRRPKTLSGGQRQRVAVGRAIVRKPKVFLFDEPLSNLDAKMRTTARAELKAMHNKIQTTSIYVTHDQVEAMTLGDRICVLYNGIVQQIAPPQQVYNKPANAFVAGFFGTPAMNFLDGLIQYRNDNAYFITNTEAVLLPPRMKTLLATYKDRQAVLGIRPEDISSQPISGQNKNAIACTVTVAEPLGVRTNIYLKSISGRKIIITASPYTNIRPDQRITIYLNLEYAHIFEPGETGRNISLDT